MLTVSVALMQHPARGLQSAGFWARRACLEPARNVSPGYPRLSTSSESARLDRLLGTVSSSLGSQVGPHLSTRFAIRHHSATWLSLALIQLTGTGASRRFSPLLAKHNQPLLYSDATAPRVPGCERRSPSTRCSIRNTAFSTGDRRSIFRRSIDDGCTIHTSHCRPRASRKVRYPEFFAVWSCTIQP